MSIPLACTHRPGCFSRVVIMRPTMMLRPAAKHRRTHLALMAASAGHPMIYWFSGWRPSGGMVIGIDYAVGPLGAGMASLAGVLASAALVYCWRYFDSARGRHHALVLIFLAA